MNLILLNNSYVKKNQGYAVFYKKMEFVSPGNIVREAAIS